MQVQKKRDGNPSQKSCNNTEIGIEIGSKVLDIERGDIIG